MNGRNGLKFLPESDTKAYEALGNAINVKVAMLVARELVGDARSNGHHGIHQIPLAIRVREGAGRGG